MGGSLLQACNLAGCGRKRRPDGRPLLVCGSCRHVFYCGPEHQRADWRTHKASCKLLRAKEDYEENLASGEYVGTLRWGKDTKFPELPPRGRLLAPLAGWEEYINYRLPANGEGNTVVEPTLLDGLSFPLTFLWATFKVGLRAALPALATERRLTVVVMGGSERAEERLLLQTTYLQEISAYFPGVAVHLVLSGPEMSKAGHKATKAWSGLRVTRFRGTAGDVMRELPEAFEGPCVAVGFNTGFGSGDARLVASWKGDLRRLQDRGVPVVFTCANDYNDLRKETKILQEGFQFDYLLKPTPSPFKALTTYHLPGEQDTSWTCANSWTYVVVGRANVVRGAGAGAAGPRPRPAAPEAAHPAGKIADLDLDAMD